MNTNDFTSVVKKQYAVICILKKSVLLFFVLSIIVPGIIGAVLYKMGVIVAGLIIFTIACLNVYVYRFVVRILTQEKYSSYENYLQYVGQKVIEKINENGG